MKESMRRIILFVIIVSTGSVMILFDVPLTIMIPLIIVIGFFILLLLGALTLAEIRTALLNLKPANSKKTGIIRRLDEIKFFEKTPPALPDKKLPSKQGTKEKAPVPDTKTGMGGHLRLFMSSLGSLGTVLKERSRRKKKVEDINKLLDKTVSERVKDSALASAGTGVDTTLPAQGGAGVSGPTGGATDSDPFLSLSDDEFDSGLLDGLDDTSAPARTGSVTKRPAPGSSESQGPLVPDASLSLPPLDLSAEAGDILKENSPGLEEFSGLEGGESIDKDFGDLDNLSLDDVDLDTELEGEIQDKSRRSTPAPGGTPEPDSASPPGTGEIKTDWIPSDAPKGAEQPEDQVSTHADMAAFAKGPGSDEDLMSSLASDVKHVKKDKNLSLLRELKDFKAPASEIEEELGGMYTRMDAARSSKKKTPSPPKE